MIVCMCRGKSDRHVASSIDAGAASLSDLQLCGIGDQCGSCHNVLRGMLARSRAESAQAACPVCVPEPAPVAVHV